ncbi:hypothetical protein B9Z55_022402 [Caenorhabditis nigoni]|uniref:Uncharacterized protein n=1 Tax=Caenorhabditis nigoni TaxID=1611254 RepID=A0A2G5SKI6_9PELO|nr:hypothetical protein B9Z55_022402 [Caenorhabditis nigoni]
MAVWSEGEQDEEFVAIGQMGRKGERNSTEKQENPEAGVWPYARCVCLTIVDQSILLPVYYSRDATFGRGLLKYIVLTPATKWKTYQL